MYKNQVTAFSKGALAITLPVFFLWVSSLFLFTQKAMAVVPHEEEGQDYRQIYEDEDLEPGLNLGHQRLPSQDQIEGKGENRFHEAFQEDGPPALEAIEIDNFENERSFNAHPLELREAEIPVVQAPSQIQPEQGRSYCPTAVPRAVWRCLSGVARGCARKGPGLVFLAGRLAVDVANFTFIQQQIADFKKIIELLNALDPSNCAPGRDCAPYAKELEEGLKGPVTAGEFASILASLSAAADTAALGLYVRNIFDGRNSYESLQVGAIPKLRKVADYSLFIEFLPALASNARFWQLGSDTLNRLSDPIKSAYNSAYSWWPTVLLTPASVGASRSFFDRRSRY